MATVAVRAGALAARQREPLTVYQMPPTVSNGMTWDRSEALALATARCYACRGSGLVAIHWHQRLVRSGPCNCVFRSIFRAIMRKYRYLSEFRVLSRVSCAYVPLGGSSHQTYGRKSEEYLADVWLVAKRTLDALHWRVFRMHFIEGSDWRECTRVLKLNRGNFFHAVYRIEQKLGRVFRELRPYALFPVDQYFDGTGDHPSDQYYRKNATGAHYRKALPAA